MKVFICWSERRSKQLAEALHQWLPSVLKDLAPTYSPDISKGELWFDSIHQELNSSQAGIVCLTPENMDSAWIHFEAGALFRQTNKNIHPSIQSSRWEPSWPRLSNSQVPKPQGRISGDLLKRWRHWWPRRPQITGRLKTFEEQWPVFETHLNMIRALTVQELIPNLEGLFKRKTYNEPLVECKPALACAI